MFKAFRYKQAGLMEKNMEKCYVAEIQYARGKTEYGDSQRQVGISSESKMFLKYECISLILQQSNSLKSERHSN